MLSLSGSLIRNFHIGNMHSKLHMVTFILLIIGGLNWLLYALGYNLVGMVFGGFLNGMLEDLIYILVGLSAIYEAATHKKNCRMCDPAAGTHGSTA